MNCSESFRRRAVPGTAVACMILWFFLSADMIHAAHCEILSYDTYQTEQDVLVTDWVDRAPYMRHTTEIYRCARISFRNTFWQAVYSTDFEVTATFEDRSTKSRKIPCDRKLLEPGETSACSICFETDALISHLECNLR